MTDENATHVFIATFDFNKSIFPSQNLSARYPLSVKTSYIAKRHGHTSGTFFVGPLAIIYNESMRQTEDIKDNLYFGSGSC